MFNLSALLSKILAMAEIIGTNLKWGCFARLLGFMYDDEHAELDCVVTLGYRDDGKPVVIIVEPCDNEKHKNTVDHQGDLATLVELMDGLKIEHEVVPEQQQQQSHPTPTTTDTSLFAACEDLSTAV